MTFTRPTIGPKVYISRGPSGHAETFGRERADNSLKAFLGHFTLRIALDGFVRMKARERSPDRWGDIIGFLSNLVGVAEEHVPLDVSVAFWAQIHLEREAKTRTSLLTEKEN